MDVKNHTLSTNHQQLGDKSAQKLSSKSHINQQYDQVAQGMEEQFLYELIKEMKKSVPQNEPKTAGQDFYESLQDQERAAIMAQQGIGIKEMILKQIRPQQNPVEKSAQGYGVKGVYHE